MTANKTVLVTGASSGIGRATAGLLAERGHTVFGTSRNPALSEGLPGVIMLQLDVRSDESVKTCLRNVMERTERLDVLVNNAGIVLAGAAEDVTLEQAQDQFETNFFGALRMIKAVLPVMRKQGSGRIINISSFAGLSAMPFVGLYSASKYALEGLTESLRSELRALNIEVSLVEPGYSRTNIAKNRHRGAEPVTDYDPARNNVFQRIREEESRGIHPRLVAEKILAIAEDRSPGLRYGVGRGARLVPLLRLLPQGLYERLMRRYWNLDARR